MTPTVLVTGVGGPAGRSLVGQLLTRGVEVIGVDMASVSLPGVHTVRVPPANDRTFVPVLMRIAHRFDAVAVIPTVSEELLPLSELAASSDAVGPRVVVAPEWGVVIASDKWHTATQLAQAGVPVPRSALPTEVPTSRQRAGWLGMPYVSKPRVGRGGRGVTVRTHENGDCRLADTHILQEFVPGIEYAPNLYLADDPDRDVVVVLEKTALAHGAVGNALHVDRVEAPDVADVALAAARTLGLRGPADIDVRRRSDGTPVVLEVNARFGANSAHAPEVLDALLAEHCPTADLTP